MPPWHELSFPQIKKEYANKMYKLRGNCIELARQMLKTICIQEKFPFFTLHLLNSS